jgi:peptide/nickel transport system permease protein
VTTVYLVLSLTFALVAFTPDPNAALVGFAAATQGESAREAMNAYEAARNLDAPILRRYVRFLVDLSTFDLGTSLDSGRPVTALVSEAGLVSLAYVVPAVVVSTAVGSALGVYTTVRNSPVLDRLVAAGSYGALGVPNFYLAAVVLAAGTAWGVDLRASPTAPATATPLATLALAALVLTTTLLGAQLRYVRGETASRASMAFVRTVRAKGAGRLRVARHLLRVAALPLLSLFAAELLGVLFVGTFVVEAILDVPGLGTLLLDALDTRDVPVVVGAALAFVLVAVVVTVVQDLLRESLDPRTDPGGE